MTTEATHLLKVFLCHASGDKPPVRELYRRLVAEGVDAWLDQERLLPGQDWRLEIPRAVQDADVVVICLSKKSITKEGYVQKEIKFALDIAEEKPEGTIFLIPARLEDCVVPERLSRWQWVDLYEENGFIRLLRSLKLRADAVGASIEPTLYEDSDKERAKRIKQLYTEGLAAFYTEDWDRACHRFQSILSEQPNHKNAAEKLAEADRQRSLSKLYEQASEAVRSEDWGPAIQILEDLSQKSANYKDAAQLLRNARKQEQLRELYAEAKTLHEAQKWEAVVRVFEQINGIDPNYGDSEGLLPSAKREVAELQRLAGLNDLYSRGVEEMDAGHWYEARRLLEQVHKSETGFLETEKLLKKVEEEIAREEEKRRQNDQINTLYEQAHGLLRSKKWRNALDKMEEIRKLEEHFPDTDGIADKARKELTREEQEAERQNKLAALYAEAVKLLKEEKYQEALDKWGEVRAVDPKYPDRQWVQRTARRKLAETAKPVQFKPRFVMSRQLWMGVVGLIIVGAVITGALLSGGENQGVLLVSTQKTTQTSTVRPANPTATVVTKKTNTPRPPTATIVPSQTPLPGKLVLPIEAFGKTIPWLPNTTSILTIHFVGFNNTRAPFDNTFVRQAFAYAIDRQQIVDMAQEYGLGDVELATTLTPPEILGRDLSGEVGISFDPQKAKELFSKAGYSDPSVFPSVTLLVSVGGTVAPGARFNMANAMAEMWKTYLGVTVQIQDTNWNGFINRLQTNPPDLYFMGWAADYNDPDNFLRGIFHSDSQGNYGNWSNSEFDQLVDLAAKSEDPAERQELYIRAERLLCEIEAAVIPIYRAK